jgi:hypothetical protein
MIEPAGVSYKAGLLSAGAVLIIVPFIKNNILSNRH